MGQNMGPKSHENPMRIPWCQTMVKDNGIPWVFDATPWCNFMGIPWHYHGCSMAQSWL